MFHAPRLNPSAVLAFVLLAGALVAPLARPAVAAVDPDRAAIQSVLDHAGLLANPFDRAAAPAEIGPMHVVSDVRASDAQLDIAYSGADASGRFTTATVTVRRWLTGTLEIRQADARGREQVMRKDVRDSCARQVTLRRQPDATWRVSAVSALVRLTPSGRATLPLVDLNTHEVSGGFLSVLSDLDELAVLPQTCAVALPGEGVHVFVGGLDPDAVVCVFAGGQCVTASRRDDSHAEAVIALGDGAGLRQIGVTVFPRRTLSDASAPADTRSWVLPILVGSVPAPTQEYFAL